MTVNPVTADPVKAQEPLLVKRLGNYITLLPINLLKRHGRLRHSWNLLKFSLESLYKMRLFVDCRCDSGN
jgi:aspartokinase-like uncharacterized kinase